MKSRNAQVKSEFPNLLLVGGAVRNVGKTALTCKIIKHFSVAHGIFALKVKTIYEGDTFFHGKDDHPLDGNFRIFEEKNTSGNEDSQRLLAAGAKKVFRIKAKHRFLKDAFEELMQKTPKDTLWVCESNSLRDIITPGIFLMILNKDHQKIKPSAERLKPYADRFIQTDGTRHDFSPAQLNIEENKWRLV